VFPLGAKKKAKAQYGSKNVRTGGLKEGAAG